jgi:hypothetical protein
MFLMMTAARFVVASSFYEGEKSKERSANDMVAFRV